MKKRYRIVKEPRETSYMYRHHVDEPWIQDKIAGHGGSYLRSTPTSLAIIGYLGHKGRLWVWYYNLILFTRYLKRVYYRSYPKS